MKGIMKNMLLISSMILMCIRAAYSQENPPVKENPPLRIGIDIAPGIAWIKPNSSNISSDGSRFGFLYGLMGSIILHLIMEYHPV